MIETPMLIFKTKCKSYSVQGVPNNICRLYYKSDPKGWNDKIVFLEYIKDTHCRRDQHERTRILLMDNYSVHNDNPKLRTALASKNTIIRFFPPS